MGTAAESTMVDGNHISWYTWDGIRALADYCTYQYNRFTENLIYKVNIIISLRLFHDFSVDK